ncbi:glycosyltransferase family 2 protein [Pseudomonas helleri]|uniref:glycosyltransferase family 2 protein n=1 Tax=Pseudomonas helleri TaxID=1608996 RepID=UPI0028E89B48|nr:glycosyltransferase family 2 protein [Pseudomonas helleri]
MKIEPLVSCIIPTKNRTAQAHDAIKSLISQSYKNIEILIIDDASTPPFEISNDLKSDTRISITRMESSVGGARARNAGMKNVKGEFFCFLDDDDIYLPNKISDLINILIARPEYDAAIGECIVLDTRTGEKSFTPQTDFSPARNTLKNRVHTNSTIINSRVLDKIRFNESLEKFQDTQFNTDLCFKFKVIYTPTAIAVWHVNWSGNQITTIKATFRNTKNYFRLIKHFIRTTKIPMHLLYWHFYKLTSFAIRLK